MTLGPQTRAAVRDLAERLDHLPDGDGVLLRTATFETDAAGEPVVRHGAVHGEVDRVGERLAITIRTIDAAEAEGLRSWLPCLREALALTRDGPAADAPAPDLRRDGAQRVLRLTTADPIEAAGIGLAVVERREAYARAQRQARGHPLARGSDRIH